ncbi:hypothetical protein ABHZ65_20865 [Bacteroides uniformis]
MILIRDYMLSPKATERIITEAVEAVKDWQALRVKPEIGRQEMDRFINFYVAFQIIGKYL